MITTTVVGSYPQPDWLVDRERFKKNVVPRIRMPEVWRVAPAQLDEAQDDAVRVAVGEMERAGIDVISDGEQRRESYFNRFANALGGVDPDRPGSAIARLGRPTPVPRIVGPIERVRPISVPEAAFLRSITDRRIKITVPGPFTLSSLAQDEHYGDPAKLAMAYAAAVNAELRELEPIVDWLQLDEPYLQAHPDRGRAYGLAAIDRALAGISKPTCIHLCFGYAYSHALAGSTKSGGYQFLTELEQTRATQVSIEAAQPRLDLSVLEGMPSKTIVVGVLDLGDATAETPDVVARRLEAALRHVPAARLVAAPDCGMKYLPRGLARAKLGALAAGAALVG
ncbi:MAG TPA: cobalamin-independent methionine synthase II family protein [Methylomirabilota bacterium]|jgi:5-methyltetrahydropteroyltriglutamate--homocysteine methyltransferase|nr:cobalamin-independent methionine synthase II family protein [Methylomirabilota bacterium]